MARYYPDMTRAWWPFPQLSVIMRTIFHFVFFLLLLSLAACRDYQGLNFDAAWNNVKEKPDSVLAVLKDLSISDFNSPKRRAEFALLKSVALDKSYIDVTSDSLIRIALDYYDSRRGNDHERMLSWYYLGRVYANSKDYNNAIVAIIRAEEISEHLDDPYYKALICMAKENIYSNTHNYSEALQAAQAGVRVFDETGEKRQALFAKRRLALDNIAVRNFSSADSLLLGMIHDKSVDSVLIGRCLLNYAWSQALQERFPEAVSFFEEGISTYHTPLSIPQMEEYGVALYHMGRVAEADALRDRLKKIPSARKSYLLLCLQSCKREGRFEEAFNYQRERMRLEDSVVVQTLEQSLIKSQRDYQQKNSEMFQLKATNRKLALIGIILLSGIAILSLLLCIIQVKRRHRLKEEKMLEMQDEIQMLLKDANERNTQLENQLALARKQYISSYKKRFSKIAHLSETYFRTSGSKEGRELVYREVRNLASFLTTDNRTYKRLEEDVNASLSGAMDWFRKEYVDLDEPDYHFVCYLMAGFPASTISLLTGLSPANVYVRKNRLLEDIRNNSPEHKDLFLLVLK